MDKERIAPQLLSHSLLDVHQLKIAPELIGQTHRFSFNGHLVEIALPSLEMVSVDRSSSSRAVCQGWQLTDSGDIPIEYTILKVEVRIILNEKPNIHPAMLNLNINQYDLLDTDERAILEQLCCDYSQLSKRVFLHWLSVLRWRTDYFRLGRYPTGGIVNRWHATLCSAENQKRVWAGTVTVNMENVHRISVSEWESAAQNLSDGNEPPPYINLLHEAQEHSRVHDYRRCIIDLAVACEIYLRSRVLSGLPDEIPNQVLDFIESANVSQYVNRFYPELLDPIQQKVYNPLKKDLPSLFDARNKIMHMDNNERSTAEKCERFIALTYSLLRMSNL